MVYRKSLLQELPKRDMTFFSPVDILVRLIRKGYLFAEVPYRLRERRFGASKAVSLRSLLEIIKGYLGLFFDCYIKRDLRLPKDFAEDSLTATKAFLKT